MSVDRIDVIGARGAAHHAPKSREQLAAALVDAREYTRRCYAHIAALDPVFPRIAIVNPARWELGHIGWFQEFWCRRYRADDPAGAGTPSHVAHADALWDSARVAHETRWALPLPDWRDIERYLEVTLADTLKALDASRDGDRYFFELALYHEDMHGEALVMTLQTLGLPPPPGWEPSQHGADRLTEQADLTFDGGMFRIGSLPDDARSRFVFDNEKWAHEVVVAPFSIARSCVTEGEFAAFVDDGGYRRLALWTDAGRRWLTAAAAVLPACWRHRADGYEVRWFDRWRALSPGTPMQHVNAHEAAAWCNWAGRRLPTEAEWEFAATQPTAIGADSANLDARSGGPIGTAGPSAGLAHLIGNVWEWTATPFRPYPGFASDPYAEYSAPWFGNHHVIRGGSWATRSRLVHARMRNFYLPDRLDMFVGFRSGARS